MVIRFVHLCVLLAALFSLTRVYGEETGVPQSENNTPFEVLKYRVDYEVEADGTFTRSTESLYLLKTKLGVDSLTQASISFSEQRETGELIEVFTLKPDGRRIDAERDQIFTRASPMAINAPMFDDNKIVIGLFPGAQIGDRVGFKSRTVVRIPLFPNQFSSLEIFSRDVITRDAEITLTAPIALPIKIDVAQLDNAPPTETEGKLRWRWTYKNEALAPIERGSVADFDRNPHIVVSTFKDFTDLAEAYNARALDKAVPSEEIVALASKITDGTDDPKEQARELYEWVSRNIRYVAINLGNGAIVPHQAADILKNRYGDCKDHVTLLQALLSAKSIESTGVLIGTGAAYKLPRVAAIGLFNHIVTYLPRWNLYLDSTASYYPMESYPIEYGDKPVLHVDNGEVRRIPVYRPENRVTRAISHVTVLEDGSADIDTTVDIIGPYTAWFRRTMAGMTRRDQEDSFLRAQFGSGVEGSFVHGNWQEWSKNYSFTAHYTEKNMIAVPGPGAVGGGILAEGSVRSWLTRGLSERHHDYVCYPGTVIEEVEQTFPKSLNIVALPRSGHWSQGDYTLDLTYQRVAKNKIRAVRKLVYAPLHQVCSAEAYNQSQQQLDKLRGALRSSMIYR
jgi:transglutaminase-like putative cysteine protease